MAGILCSTNTAQTAATMGTSAKTVIAVKPLNANTRVLLKKWGIYFDSTSSSAVPITVKLFRTDGTTAGTSTAGTVVRVGAGTETPTTTSGVAFSVEPTTKTYLDTLYIHPQQGWKEFVPLDGQIPLTGSSTGSWLGIEVTMPVAVDVICCLVFEE
jgi:hypothetical protein